MKRVGLIGHGLKHSPSAFMQQAAFDHHGLEARYELWDTPPEDLEQRMASLRGPDYLGANVTIPHKQTVIPFLDELDDVATKAGAVNTIVHEGEHLTGHNTDGVGFARALTAAGFDVSRVRAAVLGAGGAARAVALALIDGGAELVSIADAVPERAAALTADLRPIGHPHTILTCTFWGDDAFQRSIRDCGLLVNCTPVGMRFGPAEGQSPVEAALIPESCLAFDVVYNPEETPFLQAARSRGAQTAGGISMLVHQGAASFHLWTGLEAPVELMFQAVREALRG
jgi:shikimate dehydrogenase